MQERKTKNFQLGTRWQVLWFRLRFWWRKSNYWWLRIKSLNMGRNQTKKHFSENSNCHKSAAWIRTSNLFTESSSANGKFSMETLVQQSITVVNENYELGFPDNSILLNFSWTFWLSGLWSKDHKHWFSSRIIQALWSGVLLLQNRC